MRIASRRQLLGGAAWCALVGGLCVSAQTPGNQGGGAVSTLTVRADAPGAAIAPTMYGIFFEDINFGADGGLYAERVKNRSFEFPDPLMGWKRAAIDGSRGTFTIRTDAPPSAQNTHYLRLTSSAGLAGVTNDGFRGIGIRKGERYRVAVHARQTSDAPVTLRIELENAGSRPLGGVTLNNFSRKWQRYTGTIVAESTDARARLRVLVQGPSSDAATSRTAKTPPAVTLDVDMVSLFPEDTWEGRENGLRRDLVQLLKDLQPGFLRFPGGCIVEGRFLDGRYQWKTTIGDPAERRLIINRWNDEFPHKATPDYYQTFGLGFFEYFQLSEDLGAEPLPILNCGMACQFNSSELAPLDAIDPYIQDALDLIEFANGPVTSTWGRRRQELGHPAPFNLKFIGVGNEQWGPQYVERYALFAKVLKEKHPEIRLISSAGPSASGERFDFLWSKLRELKADLVDEHYYMPPHWFYSNSRRYDNYPRTGPKVFAGEFAAHAPVAPTRGLRPSTLNNALAEAAFMTGLERNADVVELASYAPLFAHVDAWQWTPNLIWFDNLRSFGTPSYHVQQLFGANRGTHVLPLTIDGATDGTTVPAPPPTPATPAPAPTPGAPPPPPPPNGIYASASFDARTGDVIVKLVNPTPQPKPVRVDLTGKRASGAARALVLTGDPAAENSLDTPNAITPASRAVQLASGGRIEEALPPHSLTVFRVAVK